MGFDRPVIIYFNYIWFVLSQFTYYLRDSTFLKGVQTYTVDSGKMFCELGLTLHEYILIMEGYALAQLQYLCIMTMFPFRGCV